MKRKRIQQQQRDLEKKKADLAAAKSAAEAERLRLLEEAKKKAKETKSIGSVSGLTRSCKKWKCKSK